MKMHMAIYMFTLLLSPQLLAQPTSLEQQLAVLHASTLGNPDLNAIIGDPAREQTLTKTELFGAYFGKTKYLSRIAPPPPEVIDKQLTVAVGLVKNGLAYSLDLSTMKAATIKDLKTADKTLDVVMGIDEVSRDASSPNAHRALVAGKALDILLPVPLYAMSEAHQARIKWNDYLSLRAAQAETEFKATHQTLVDQITQETDQAKRREHEAILNQIAAAHAGRVVFEESWKKRESAGLTPYHDSKLMRDWLASTPSIDSNTAAIQSSDYYDALRRAALHYEAADIKTRAADADTAIRTMVRSMATISPLTPSTIRPQIEAFISGKTSRTEFEEWTAKNTYPGSDRPVGAGPHNLTVESVRKGLLNQADTYTRTRQTQLPSSYSVELINIRSQQPEQDRPLLNRAATELHQAIQRFRSPFDQTANQDTATPDPQIRANTSQVSQERARAIVQQYQSIPGGVTLEGTAQGIEGITSAAYDPAEHCIHLPEGIRYRIPIHADDAATILSAIGKDDKLGVSLGATTQLVYGALPADSRVAEHLRLADRFLGNIAFGRADQLVGYHFANDYTPQLEKTSKSNVAVYFNISNFAFELSENTVRLAQCEFNATLVPLTTDKARDGGHSPDYTAVTKGETYPAYQKNIEHLTEQFAYYRRERIVRLSIAYGEVAAVARTLKKHGVDLQTLARSIDTSYTLSVPYQTDEQHNTVTREDTPDPSWVIPIDASGDKQVADRSAARLREAGFEAGTLWIPDYKSLSGAQLFTSYIGPIPTRHEAKEMLARYKSYADQSDAYAIRLDQNPHRETIALSEQKEFTNGSRQTSNTEREPSQSYLFRIVNVPQGDHLNVRSTPQIETSNIVVKLEPHEGPLRPTGNTHPPWVQITYNTYTGWVHTKYVSPTPTQVPHATNTTPPKHQAPGRMLAVISIPPGDHLNLRSTPERPREDDNIIEQIPPGAEPVTGTGRASGDWIEIIYQGTTGWAHSKYLTPIQ